MGHPKGSKVSEKEKARLKRKRAENFADFHLWNFERALQRRWRRTGVLVAGDKKNVSGA